MVPIIEKYDNNGKVIYTKNEETGFEEIIKRNKDGRIIYVERSNGYKKWIDRNKNGRITRVRYSSGLEKIYDGHGNLKKVVNKNIIKEKD